jgi:hypothetical protein
MTSLNILDFKFLRTLFNKFINLVNTYRHYKKYKKNEEKIILYFFNFKLPCNQSINLCEELRNEFLNEISEARNNKICTGCVLSLIKYKYVKKLLEAQNL